MASTKRRILCVDDNDDTCFMMSALFGQLDYEIMTASSVSEALHLARTDHFDLFILDRYFPDGEGFDLCRRILELDPQAAIIFYTGDADPVHRDEALCAGAKSYLIKPDLNKLIATVQLLLMNKAKNAAAD